MQIDEATKQATAPETEVGGRISPRTGLGAEVGTAANGQTKAEGLRQGMDAVVERSNLWQAYERVLRNKGAGSMDSPYSNQGMAAKALAERQSSATGGIIAGGDTQWKYPAKRRGTHTGHPTVLDRLIQQAFQSCKRNSNLNSPSIATGSDRPQCVASGATTQGYSEDAAGWSTSIWEIL